MLFNLFFSNKLDRQTPYITNPDFLKELNEKGNKRLKLKKISIDDFDMPEISNLSQHVIEETLDKIRESQKCRANLIKENFNCKTESPKKSLSLHEIENIPFKKFCEEIENKNDKYPKINKKDNVSDLEETEKLINKAIEKNEEINLKNSKSVAELMLTDQDIRSEFKGLTPGKSGNFGVTAGKNIITKSNNVIKGKTKEEYVNSVIEFIANLIHEDKIKYKF